MACCRDGQVRKLEPTGNPATGIAAGRNTTFCDGDHSLPPEAELASILQRSTLHEKECVMRKQICVAVVLAVAVFGIATLAKSGVLPVRTAPLSFNDRWA